MRLEELQEEHHGCGPVLRAARTDLKTALADSGQTLAAEAIASEARTRSVCDFLVKNAATQLADRDRTITALRAELEQDRTGRSRPIRSCRSTRWCSSAPWAAAWSR